MLIVLTVARERITDARYSTYGCPAAQACGQFVTERVEGMTRDEAALIDNTAIVAGVGKMPLGREHCPGLAVTALRDAIANSRETGP
jgi:NifU-like protein involved in Fe-S cluster formation